MNHIVKRLIENHRLCEMAMEQSKAISYCRSLGNQFIKHFHEVYVSGIKDIDFSHHCDEMQNWYDDVKTIKLKSNNKFISKIHLVEWFFTAGAGVEDFILSEEEIDIYNEFVLSLLSTGEKIEEILLSILSSKEGVSL